MERRALAQDSAVRELEWARRQSAAARATAVQAAALGPLRMPAQAVTQLRVNVRRGRGIG